MTNDNAPKPAWLCLDCQFDGGAGSLCRKGDGGHAFEALARSYLTEVEDEADERHRAFDCVREMVHMAPAAATGFLVVACAACVSFDELSIVAAGPLEDLLEAHGPAVIGQLEKIAKIDPRFRLMLSGTWGRERIDPDVWVRLVDAVRAGPVMSHDSRNPAAGTDAPVVTTAQLSVLFGPQRGETRH